MQPAELQRMYGAADMGVVPSVTEDTFPVALIEMMASGLPVIANRVGGVPEAIEDGVTGRLVDLPNSVDAWSEAIKSLLADPNARDALGAAARTAACSRFTPDQTIQKWNEVLANLTSV